MTLHPILLNFLIYEENFLFFFISALCRTTGPSQCLFCCKRKITNQSDARRPCLFSCSGVHRICVHQFVIEVRLFSEISPYHGGHFKFLQKLAGIFESKGWTLGSMTPAIKEKMFEIGGFFIFCWDAVGLSFTLIKTFYLQFIPFEM